MKKTILIALGLLMIQLVNAQSEDYMWTALQGDPAAWDSICESYDDYITQTYGDSIPDSVLSAYKNYLRYKYIWGRRLGVVDGNPSYIPYTEAATYNMLNPICEDGDSANWQVMGPVAYHEQKLGLVDEVLYDPLNPDRIIISSDRGGIWVRDTMDGGWGWRNVTDDLQLPALCASEIMRNPFDHNHLLASTASGILNSGNYGIGIVESFDNGETWSVQQGFLDQSQSPSPFTVRVIADPNDTIASDSLTLYAITSHRIYKSENSGISWMEFPGPGITANDNTYIDIEIDDKGAIYVSTESGHGLYADFYKFNGNNWIDLNNPVQFASSFQRIKITKPVGGKIFVLCDYQNSSGYLRRSIFETLDYGDNWTKIRTFGPVGFKNEIEYSSASNVLYCGYINLYLVDIDESSGNYYHGDDDDFHDDIRDFFFL